jgi:FkbM family methyltransferase
MKRHSQNLEQDYILEYFSKKNSLSSPTPPRWVVDGRQPTFIDIGANDGVTLSNTRALSELGWRGVFVEPSPKSFDRLKKNYEGLKGFYFYNVALGDHNGNAILQESSSLLSSSDIGLVSTFEASEMQRFKSICTYEAVTVKMFKWKTFLNRLQIKQFDFINLDVESYELHILPDMDLSKTSLLCIEHNGSAKKKEDYLHYTSKYGIEKIIYESGENLLIAR